MSKPNDLDVIAENHAYRLVLAAEKGLSGPRPLWLLYRKDGRFASQFGAVFYTSFLIEREAMEFAQRHGLTAPVGRRKAA